MGKLLVVPHPAHLNSLALAAMQGTPGLRRRLATLTGQTSDEIHFGAAIQAGPSARELVAAGGDLIAAPTKRRRRPQELEPITPKLADILEDRRSALALFAAMATASAKGVAQFRTMAFGTDGTERFLSIAERPRAVVLPSLGAIIMDDETVDRKALEQTAQVYENVLIPMVMPQRDIMEAAGAHGEDTPTRVDRLAASPWHLRAIQIDAARARGLTGAGVLVGILDTGIDSGHEEIRGKLVDGGFAEFDRGGARLDASAHDKFSHGTHVSALIAGRTVGVAPGVTLAVACVLTVATSRGPAGRLTQIARGLDWLLSTPFRGLDADPGVDVVNGSIGGVGYDAFLYTPLAQARLALGTMFIGAIGNSGQYGINHHGSPANYDISVGVGAVDQEMRVAAFSDWGTVPEHPGVAKPDLCAPGCAVWSAVPGGGYEEMDGTSMATPLVTGAAALLLERDPALSLSVAALQSQLFALTSTPPSGPRAGRGRLDLSGI